MGYLIEMGHLHLKFHHYHHHHHLYPISKHHQPLYQNPLAENHHYNGQHYFELHLDLYNHLDPYLPDPSKMDQKDLNKLLMAEALIF